MATPKCLRGKSPGNSPWRIHRYPAKWAGSRSRFNAPDPPTSANCTNSGTESMVWPKVKKRKRGRCIWNTVHHSGTSASASQGRRQDTVLLDYYHLLRMRYLTRPIFLFDPFPWLFDQLVLEPEEADESGEAH